MIISILSAVIRALLIYFLFKLVTRYRDILSRGERWGVGIMGGSGLMTIAVILDVDKQGTPFDVWTGLLFSTGAVVFIRNFIERKAGHERRNQEQIAAAERHFARKGS